MNLRRVVVTGMGFVSPLGITEESVAQGLQKGTSATVHAEPYATNNFECRVWAPIGYDLPSLDKRTMRWMGDGKTLLYGYHAMRRAVTVSGLTQDQISNPRTGIIVGSGGPSTIDIIDSWKLVAKNEGTRRIGLYYVVPTMSSGLAAKLATDFRIKGDNFAITSACATSAHCIGEAARKIASGWQDIIFAGGSEDCHETKAYAFDGMTALARGFNDTPATASRAFDADRNGFVMGAGGAILVLEELSHALARKANIYAEIVGYGLSSDGHDMVAPSGEGAIRCMQMAMEGFHGPVGPIDYLNAHGTSTEAGDLKEMYAVSEAFRGQEMPDISSTKSLTGHALGAAAALEACYSILALNGNFVPGSANIEKLCPDIAQLPAGAKIARETIDKNMNVVMSNSFGFGGTNATLVFKKFEG